ncbi:hypothetical protein, partial [Virgibacillus senegalensis]|uniref:hypothetical protein n=1 Tax=Virgibacillus senegalensis TaxID=1499679 RepID=UPI001F17B4C9
AGTASANLVKKITYPSGSSARAVPAGVTTERSSWNQQRVNEKEVIFFEWHQKMTSLIPAY